MGVRVTLIGITATAGGNQSRELRNEADELIVLDRDEVSKFIRDRTVTSEDSSSKEDPTYVRSETAEGYLLPSPIAESSASSDDLTAAASKAAGGYAGDWISRATKAEIDSLLTVYPRIPKHIDASLLVYVESNIKLSLRQNDSLRRTARAAFWDRIRLLE